MSHEGFLKQKATVRAESERLPAGLRGQLRGLVAVVGPDLVAAHLAGGPRNRQPSEKNGEEGRREGRGREWRGREWRGREWRGGNGGEWEGGRESERARGRHE